MEKDEVLIGTTYAESDVDINMCETYIDEKHEWLDLKLKEINLPDSHLIALIKRGDDYFVPNGSTKIKLSDTIVFYTI